MKNIFTVDLEDWYQGLEIPPEKWGFFEKRLQQSALSVLKLLGENNAKATFFVLGDVARQYPGLIKRISQEGHEIGTHGYSHKFVYNQTPDEFRKDLNDSMKVISDITGMSVKLHRAPFFSITKESLWAFDILSELGIECDSSVFPTVNYRYGIIDAPTVPYSINTGSGRSIKEIPITTFRFMARNMPFSGGAYFRIFPYWFVASVIKNLNKKSIPVVFYMHPWEIDPGHPRIKLPKRVSLTHYYNLSGCRAKLKRLLSDFQFTTMSEGMKSFSKT